MIFMDMDLGGEVETQGFGNTRLMVLLGLIDMRTV